MFGADLMTTNSSVASSPATASILQVHVRCAEPKGTLLRTPSFVEGPISLEGREGENGLLKLFWVHTTEKTHQRGSGAPVFFGAVFSEE